MFEIKNQNKGIEDYIGYRFPLSYLLFGETIPHLTSKWRGTFQYFQFFFNVENRIKREMKWEKIGFLKKHPPRNFYVGNSLKREENMKYWKQILTFFFQYLKKFIKNSNNIPSISKTTQHTPRTWYTYLQFFEKIHQCIFELQCKN